MKRAPRPTSSHRPDVERIVADLVVGLPKVIRRVQANDYRQDADLLRQAAAFVLEPKVGGGRR